MAFTFPTITFDGTTLDARVQVDSGTVTQNDRLIIGNDEVTYTTCELTVTGDLSVDGNEVVWTIAATPQQAGSGGAYVVCWSGGLGSGNSVRFQHWDGQWYPEETTGGVLDQSGNFSVSGVGAIRIIRSGSNILWQHAASASGPWTTAKTKAAPGYSLSSLTMSMERSPGPTALEIDAINELGGGGGGSSAPTFVAASSQTTGTGTTQTPTVPAGVQAGDLVLAHVTIRSTASITAPSGQGWSDTLTGGLGSRTGLRDNVFAKIWGLGGQIDDTTPTFTVSSGTSGWGTTISVFRNPNHATNPWTSVSDAIGGAAMDDDDAASTTMVAPAVAISGDELTVLRFYGSGDDNNHGSPSAGSLGYGGTAYDQSTGNDYAQSLAYEADVDLASTTGTATMSQQSNGADIYISRTIVLLPTASTIPLEITASGASSSVGALVATAGLTVAAAGASSSTGLLAATSEQLATAAGSSTSSGAAAITRATSVAASGASASTGSAAVSLARDISGSGSSTSTGSLAASLARNISAAGSSSSTGAAQVAMTARAAASGASSSVGALAATAGLVVAAAGASSSTGLLAALPLLVTAPSIPGTAPVEGEAFTATAATWQGSTSVERQWEYEDVTAVSASGSSTSSGSAAVTAVLQASAVGSSATVGALTIAAQRVVVASGASASIGAAQVALDAAASASGASASIGAAAIALTAPVSAAGASSSTGSITTTHNVAGNLPLNGSGSSTSSGQLTTTALFTPTLAGVSDSTGGLAVTAELTVGALGASSSTGSLAATIEGAPVHEASASGSSSSTGSLAVTASTSVSASGASSSTGSLATSVEGAPTHAISGTGSSSSSGELTVTHLSELVLDGQAVTVGRASVAMLAFIAASGSSSSLGALAAGLAVAQGIKLTTRGASALMPVPQGTSAIVDQYHSAGASDMTGSITGESQWA